MKLGSEDTSNDPLPLRGSVKVDMGVTKKDSLLPLEWKDGSIVFVKLPNVIVVCKLIPSPAVCFSVTPFGLSVVAMVTCMSELNLSSCFDSNVFEP